ncbi:VOC family protein [Pollutibacter soli]|uniref:VOC family protein n=1 Tax=Pollutibacter soli TaxID=3034157 RepID=UPI00301340FD
MSSEKKFAFAPQLYIPHGVEDVSFYVDGLGARELRRFSNDDGTVHVAEFLLGDQIFHLHETSERINCLSPAEAKSSTVMIGLFVDDVDAVMQSAEKAGAKIINPAQDYDYGYRQGELVDPFGHLWLIEKSI